MHPADRYERRWRSTWPLADTLPDFGSPPRGSACRPVYDQLQLQLDRFLFTWKRDEKMSFRFESKLVRKHISFKKFTLRKFSFKLKNCFLFTR